MHKKNLRLLQKLLFATVALCGYSCLFLAPLPSVLMLAYPLGLLAGVTIAGGLTFGVASGLIPTPARRGRKLVRGTAACFYLLILAICYMQGLLFQVALFLFQRFTQ